MKYYLLGKSGLRVSELALGAMSFGTEWGWGIELNEARKMLDLYIDSGETLGKFTQRNMQIVDEVKNVASEVKKSPAQVALAWLLSRSTVTSVLLGASKLEQLENNLGSLNTHLGPDQIKRLDDLSSVEMGFPHAILANPTIKQTISGGVEVHRKVALRLKVSGDPEYQRA